MSVYFVKDPCGFDVVCKQPQAGGPSVGQPVNPCETSVSPLDNSDGVKGPSGEDVTSTAPTDTNDPSYQIEG